MLLTNKILPGQTLLDIALQELGDLERLFEIAVDNDISVTNDMEVGSQLSIGLPERVNRGLVQVFTPTPRRPASDDSAGEVNAGLEGIDHWAIGFDFIVQ